MPSFLLNPLPETIIELEDQLAALETLQQECKDALRDYMEREDPVHDVVYPSEIHELRQHKNVLETHKDFRKVRIRRLQSMDGF